jgi:hypothetical protein
MRIIVGFDLPDVEKKDESTLIDSSRRSSEKGAERSTTSSNEAPNEAPNETPPMQEEGPLRALNVADEVNTPKEAKKRKEANTESPHRKEDDDHTDEDDEDLAVYLQDLKAAESDSDSDGDYDASSTDKLLMLDCPVWTARLRRCNTAPAFLEQVALLQSATLECVKEVHDSADDAGYLLDLLWSIVRGCMQFDALYPCFHVLHDLLNMPVFVFGGRGCYSAEEDPVFTRNAIAGDERLVLAIASMLSQVTMDLADKQRKHRDCPAILQADANKAACLILALHHCAVPEFTDVAMSLLDHAARTSVFLQDGFDLCWRFFLSCGRLNNNNNNNNNNKKKKKILHEVSNDEVRALFARLLRTGYLQMAAAVLAKGQEHAAYAALDLYVPADGLSPSSLQHDALLAAHRRELATFVCFGCMMRSSIMHVVHDAQPALSALVQAWEKSARSTTSARTVSAESAKQHDGRVEDAAACWRAISGALADVHPGMVIFLLYASPRIAAAVSHAIELKLTPFDSPKIHGHAMIDAISALFRDVALPKAQRDVVKALVSTRLAVGPSPVISN